MDSKVCSVCKEQKPLTDFDILSYRKDGHRSQCKACRATWYQNNKQRENERRKAWGKANPEKQRMIYLNKYRRHRLEVNTQKKSRRKFPELGLCSVTGCNEIGQRHHPDYSNPDEVIWLCSKHHRLLHA